MSALPYVLELIILISFRFFVNYLSNNKYKKRVDTVCAIAAVLLILKILSALGIL